MKHFGWTYWQHKITSQPSLKMIYDLLPTPSTVKHSEALLKCGSAPVGDLRLFIFNLDVRAW